MRQEIQIKRSDKAASNSRDIPPLVERPDDDKISSLLLSEASDC